MQKWVLQNGVWNMVYVLNAGLNIGVQYSVGNDDPSSIDPATGGCRNITGRVNRDGTATIWATTSTVSANGDNGADPNKLVKGDRPGLGNHAAGRGQLAELSRRRVPRARGRSVARQAVPRCRKATTITATATTTNHVETLQQPPRTSSGPGSFVFALEILR